MNTQDDQMERLSEFEIIDSDSMASTPVKSLVISNKIRKEYNYTLWWNYNKAHPECKDIKMFDILRNNGTLTENINFPPIEHYIENKSFKKDIVYFKEKNLFTFCASGKRSNKDGSYNCELQEDFFSEYINTYPVESVIDYSTTSSILTIAGSVEVSYEAFRSNSPTKSDLHKRIFKAQQNPKQTHKDIVAINKSKKQFRFNPYLKK